jgi:hypothetical protein
MRWMDIGHCNRTSRMANATRAQPLPLNAQLKFGGNNFELRKVKGGKPSSWWIHYRATNKTGCHYSACGVLVEPLASPFAHAMDGYRSL